MDDLDAAGLRRDIYDGTEPHVLVEIEELQEPEGRLLAVRVPSGLPPDTTTDGVARIRIGKDSKPLTGSALAAQGRGRGTLYRLAPRHAGLVDAAVPTEDDICVE